MFRQVDSTCATTHVYNTLLELYLSDVAHEENISKRVERERKTLDLLQNQKVLNFLLKTTKQFSAYQYFRQNYKEYENILLFQAGYDTHQALVLCQMNNFKAGILFLYEKAKL